MSKSLVLLTVGFPAAYAEPALAQITVARSCLRIVL